MEYSQDAIIIWSNEHGIETWNRGAETLFGIGRQRALGAMPDAILRYGGDHHPEAVQDELAASGSWSGLVEYRQKDGSRIVLSNQVSRIPGPTGDTMYLQISRDVTELCLCHLPLLDPSCLQSQHQCTTLSPFYHLG